MIRTPSLAFAKFLADSWDTAAMLTYFTNGNLNYFRWRAAENHNHPSNTEYWSTCNGNTLTVLSQMRETRSMSSIY